MTSQNKFYELKNCPKLQRIVIFLIIQITVTVNTGTEAKKGQHTAVRIRVVLNIYLVGNQSISYHTGTANSLYGNFNFEELNRVQIRFDGVLDPVPFRYLFGIWIDVL